MRAFGSRSLASPVLRAALLVSFACAMTVVAHHAAAALPQPAEADRRRADSLFRAVAARTDLGKVEERREAVMLLERAAVLDGTRPEIWALLGRLHLAARYRDQARTCLELAEQLSPDDAGVQRMLGGIWKQDWLETVDVASLTAAAEHFERASTLAPGDADAGVELSAIEIARGRPGAGAKQAERVAGLHPARGDALLALGCAAFRLGDLARADSAFEAARTHLDRDLAKRFNDERWFMGDAIDGMRGARGGLREITRRYWRENDPDLTTEVSEAHLDFEARLALALLLFRDGHTIRWDERTELFVRYGPPSAIAANPPDAPLEFRYPRRMASSYAPDPLPYSYDLQVWSYPELGMRIPLWDLSLRGNFRPAISYEQDQPGPDPDVLATRPDLASLEGGRGVFRALPPGTRVLRSLGLVSRFPTATGARLVAHVVAPGKPADSLRAACAVVDADGQVVSRSSRLLAISACAPTDEKVAEFDVEVPPGEYRVDLAVSDGRGGRGLWHERTEVPDPPARMAMSDVVLLCGDATPAIGATSIRIEPNLEHRVAGSAPLSAYFELDRLTPGRGGQSRFEYTYTVRPVGRREGATARIDVRTIKASREETFVGTVRRQFLVVPISALPAGNYELAVDVKDREADVSARRSVTFTRE